jgi:predicted O-methyltransferase YrrM
VDYKTFKPLFKSMLHPNDAYAVSHFDDLAAHVFRKYTIAMAFRPRSIVEFGVRAGYGGWALAKGAADAGIVPTYVVYEGDLDKNGPSYVEHAQKIMKTAAGDVIVHTLNTRSLLPKDVPQADLFHVDADHSYDGASHELLVALDRVNAGGVVVADDFDYLLDVKRAVLDALAVNRDWLMMVAPSWRGEAVMVKPR